MESFGGRLRDELLAVEAFSTLLEARVLVEDWRIEYNILRPYSALGLPDLDRLHQGLDRQPSRTLIADGPTGGVGHHATARSSPAIPLPWSITDCEQWTVFRTGLEQRFQCHGLP
jgi:hypothetical protein